MYTPDRFYPENVTPGTMKAIHDSLEKYLDMLNGIIVPPEDMSRRDWERMQDGIEVAQKALKRLKKNDTSIFLEDI